MRERERVRRVRALKKREEKKGRVADVRAELRTLLGDRERGLGCDRQAQLPDLPGQRNQADAERRDRDKSDCEPDPEPGLRGGPRVLDEGQRGERGGEERRPDDSAGADPRAAAEAAAGRSGPPARHRHDERDREKPEQRGSPGGGARDLKRNRQRQPASVTIVSAQSDARARGSAIP